MALGMVLGYFLRSRKKLLKILTQSTLWIIFILLFFMGISVGGNSEVMKNLDTIGIRGLQLALVAIFGSVLLSWVVYRFVFKSDTTHYER
jgi:uncharacterized membrane protein YbjE (DUF340 family)